MHWTLAQVAEALGVAAPAAAQPVARLAGVSIDSRALRAGELFVAIHGPRHDGHAFVAAAVAAGAPAAVVAHARLSEYPESLRGKLIAVDDTLAALQRLARAVRHAWSTRAGRKMAAVTGSAGKTTTKEILAALVSTKFPVLKSHGNLNNEYGLPLALLKLDDEHQAAVVELGMSHRGELAQLARIAEPEIGVVTNVAPVHLEFFSSVDEIALAKRELIEGLAGPEPVAVLNSDDPRVARFADGFRGRVLTYGAANPASHRAEEIEDRGAQGCAFDYVHPAGRARMELPLVGRHNVLNALAALAASSCFGVTVDAAQRALASLAPAAMRGEVLRFAEGFTVINDCYNSNPAALASMMGVLASMPARRRILIAGEMRELGSTAPELHRAAGQKAAAAKIDWIVGVEGHAEQIIQGAIGAGSQAAHTFFPDSAVAAEALADFLKPGDVALVKGSRGVKMELIVEAWKKHHALAGSAAKEAIQRGRG